MKLVLGWFYPNLMSIYGDRGNIIALEYRCKQRGIEFEVVPIEIDKKEDLSRFDILFFGGGQDKEQSIISEDFIGYKKDMQGFHKSNKPMLAICGGYQLLGNYFITKDEKKIPGLGLLDFYTKASDTRMIGNVIIKTNFLSDKIVGFENHSGKTYLGKEKAFADVTLGNGNNGEDKTEGVVSNGIIGTYLHGPILPKNPEFGDWLIKKALDIKYKDNIQVSSINDELEARARDSIINKLKG